LKVGKIWKFIIKYLLPFVLFAMWIYGMYDLFMSAAAFELIVDSIIMVAVLAFSIILTRLSPREDGE
jgi:NSS family neurotransmitter:Na+ symporter